MRWARAWQLGLVGGVVGWVSVSAIAAPWDKLLTTQRVDADPKKTYTVTEKNGPWMILACSFSGEQGVTQANELALELRKRYKLPAYVYEKKFDFGKDVTGRGLDRYGQPLRMKYQKGSEREEIAVLVGDFDRADDNEAQETLRKVKYLQPECLSLDKRESTSRTLAGFRMWQSVVNAGDNVKNVKKQRGPMGSAFMTTNPLLPPEAAAKKGLDELVIKANEGVDHCLLDCPGKYTVQVARFTGRVIIKQAEIDAIQRGAKQMESSLVDATEDAHTMTEALRKAGIEAYEFHDRYASIVTVGSFNSVGQPRADGVIELDPAVQAVMEKFRSQHAMAPKKLGEVVPKWKGKPILFDAQPILVHVPRRSISAMLNRSTADAR